MNLRSLLIIIYMMAAAMAVSAQRDGRSMESGVTTLLLNDTIDRVEVEHRLKENAPKAPADNGLPRFAVIGKDRQFYLALGGQFLGEGVFTWGGNMSSAIDFVPSGITKPTPGNGGATQFGWQSSSIYLNFVAMPGSDHRIGLFFKGNFTGNDNSFSCYHFFARYWGLTVGYTASAFTDEAAEPMTIDFQGPNGFVYNTLFTAYWQQHFGQHLSGAIGIDAPSASLTPSATTAIVSQRIPAVPLYLQYASTDGSAHVRVSAIVRPLQYRDQAASVNRALTGYGFQLSGMTPVWGNLSLQGAAVYGAGIGNYIQDDNGLGLDAVAVTSEGRMAAVKSLGLTAGLTCNVTSSLTANLVYSHLANYFPADGSLDAATYCRGSYVAANLIYNINRFVSAGIEYDYGHRRSIDGSGLHANRLQCQLAVTF